MKTKKIQLPIILVLIISSIPFHNIYANSPYEGKENEWLERCSTPQASAEAVQACVDFKTYYGEQSTNLEEKILGMQSSVENLDKDLANITEIIQGLEKEIEKIEQQIITAEKSVKNMQESILLLDAKIIEKQAQIKELDALVKARMENEQVSIGTNRYVDLIMGAKDVVDFIRIIVGIQRITSNDQRQIEEAIESRNELKLQQNEQARLSENLNEQIKQNEQLKLVATTGKEEQEKLYEKFHEESARKMAEIQNMQNNVASLQGNIAAINTDIDDNIFNQPKDEQETPSDSSNEGESGSGSGGSSNGSGTGDNNDAETSKPPSSGGGNSSWIKPISYAWYSGTWHYGGSSTPHLGADYSGPIGGAIVAPSKSIVLYADAKFESNSGYMFNWDGNPAGGGNTMHLLTQVKGVTYGVSLFHLSKGLIVQPGDIVEQGQLIAYSGSSGNVTGPHLHIEVVNLGNMSVTEAQKKFAATADFSWGTGWGYNGLNTTCDKKAAPCRERPETLFGY